MPRLRTYGRTRISVGKEPGGGRECCPRDCRMPKIVRSPDDIKTIIKRHIGYRYSIIGKACFRWHFSNIELKKSSVYVFSILFIYCSARSRVQAEGVTEMGMPSRCPGRGIVRETAGRFSRSLREL